MPGPFAGSVVVLSPHLDDAVLSLGASISASSRAGARVRVVTVFGGDPDSDRPASTWELQCGFPDSATASRARRHEDMAACGRIGAGTTWLPYPDNDHSQGHDVAELGDAITLAIGDATTVLIPGSPLLHPDHLLLATVVLDLTLPDVRLGLFAEQPYVFWEFAGPRGQLGRLAAWAGCLVRSPAARRDLTPVLPDALAERGLQPKWEPAPTAHRDRVVKKKAIAEYRSQLQGFGRLFTTQIALSEWGRGGEAIAWLTPA